MSEETSVAHAVAAAKRSEPPKRGRRPASWIAGVLCILLATLAVLGLASVAFLKIPATNRVAARHIRAALLHEGIDARFSVRVQLLPLVATLYDVRVAALNPASVPLVENATVRLEPRVLPLLSGKVIFDAIDIQHPRIGIVVADGAIRNLPRGLTEQSEKSTSTEAADTRFSLRTIAVTNAEVHAQIERLAIDVRGADLDLGLRNRAMSAGDLALSVDEVVLTDAPEALHLRGNRMCNVHVRARVDHDRVLLHRAELNAALYRLETAASTAASDAEAEPSCDAANAALKIEQAEVDLTGRSDTRASGHVTLSAPLDALRPFVSAPIAGELAVTADVRLPRSVLFPDIRGNVSVRDARLGSVGFGESLQAELTAAAGALESNGVDLRFADGLVRLRDVRADLLAPGIPIAAHVEVTGAKFARAFKQLGISAHPHVQWELDHVVIPSLRGTLVPLSLAGNIQAKTGPFTIFDADCEVETCEQMFLVRGSELTGKLVVGESAVEFQSVAAAVPGGELQNAYVRLGFDDSLRVDVPSVRGDLESLTPIANIPMRGELRGQVRVRGKMSSPKVESDAQVTGFVFDGRPLGDVEHASIGFESNVLTLGDVVGRFETGRYRGYELRVGFLEGALTIDGAADADGVSLDRISELFRMETEQSAIALRGNIAHATAKFHYARRTKQDICDTGYLDVTTNAKIDGASVAGESFTEINLDFRLVATNLQSILYGSTLELRSLGLRKTRDPAFGSVLLSGNLQPNGDLFGTALFSAVPLSQLQHLQERTRDVQATVSGVAQLFGNLNAFHTVADLEVSPTWIRGAFFGPSRLHTVISRRVAMTSLGDLAVSGSQRGDGCAVKRPDGIAQGEVTVDGSLFNGEVGLQHVTASFYGTPLLTGEVTFHNADLANVLRAVQNRREPVEETDLAAHFTGALFLDRMNLVNPGESFARLVPVAFSARAASLGVTMRSPTRTLVLANNTLTVEPIAFDVDVPAGQKGSFTARGTIRDVSTAPNLDLALASAPVNLGALVGLVPSLDLAEGAMELSVTVDGPLADPNVEGEVVVSRGTLRFRDIGRFSNVGLRAMLHENELSVTKLTADYGGGSVAVNGSFPIKGFGLGVGHLSGVARNTTVQLAQGIQSRLDGNVEATVDPNPPYNAETVRVVGDVVLHSLEYTRAVNLTTDLTAFGTEATKSRRTPVAEAYDPENDRMTFHLNVRANAPLKVKNELVNTELTIASQSLSVRGTDQRVGILGTLRAIKGGHLRFRGTDFEIIDAILDFDDPTRIAPRAEISAATEYTRFTMSTPYGYTSTMGGTQSSTTWKITARATGRLDDLHVNLTSDPTLPQDDILLLLAIGMTRAELDRMQSTAPLQATSAFQGVASISGADRLVKDVVPIDDFRFGSGYSTQTGRVEPQITIGKRLGNRLGAAVTTGLTEQRNLRANIEWRLGRRTSVEASYDSINRLSATTLGNIGLGFRWRFEFR